MQQEKDYIKREVDKIISFLKKAIYQLFSTGEVTNETIEEISTKFEKHLTISINDMLSLKEEEFIIKFKKTNTSILKEIINLLMEIKKKNISYYSESEIKNKILLLINLIDGKEKTFSFKRMQLKNKLT